MTNHDDEIRDRLRQQAESIQPAPGFVDNLSNRLQAEARYRQERRQSWRGWLPRLVAGLAALVVVLGGYFWLRSDGLTPLEPALADPTSAAIAPAEAPDMLTTYRAVQQPVPATPDAALAWAAEFGLAEPLTLYRNPTNGDAIVVRGGDGATLSFFANPQQSAVAYVANSDAIVTGEPPTEAEAIAAVTAFLSEREFLWADEVAVVVNPISAAQTGSAKRQVAVVAQWDGYTVWQGWSAPLATLDVGPGGAILGGSFSLVAFVPDGMVAVRDEDAVLTALAAGERPLRQDTIDIIDATGQFQTYLPPPPDHAVGETVTVSGWGTFLLPEDGGEPLASIYVNGYMLYRPTGTAVADMVQEGSIAIFTISGTITGRDSTDGAWLLSVDEWSARPATNSFQPFACVLGELVRDGDGAMIRAEGAQWDDRVPPEATYRLLDVPVELAAGTRIEACGESLPEVGEVLRWQSITSPPASENAVSEGAAVSGGELVFGSEAIERVELAYFYAPYDSDLVRPVWVVVGQEGSTRFAAFYEAVVGE